MEILNKYQATLGKKQNNLLLSPGDVGKYAVVAGDPGRVLMIAKHLESPKELANKRAFLVYSGFYKGIQIIAASHGVGCPSAALIMEEMANIGISHVIRVGSTAALQPGIRIGDLVISTGAMRNDGTTKFHVRDSFPAVPNHFLTHSLIEVALEHRSKNDYKLFVGLSACDDSFYGETPEWIRMLSEQHKLINVEMEGSTIFTIGYLRGMKTAMICSVSANLITGEYIYAGENKPLAEGWDHEISIALEAIYRHENGATLADEVDHADVQWNSHFNG